MVQPNEVAILHYAGPPIIGGVESTIYHHAILLKKHGFSVKVIAGRGTEFDAQIPFYLVNLLDSKQPMVIDVGKELSRGEITDKFTQLTETIFEILEKLLEDSRFIIVHNVITLHKNLPFTAALFRLSQSGKKLISWSHDFAWKDPLYYSELHDGFPWNLMSTPWENISYVVVSENRKQILTGLLGISEEMISVITPGIDYRDFYNISSSVVEIIDTLNLITADPLIILPARITRRKNIEFALRVTYDLSQIKPNTMLIITGPPGPHNPKNIEYLNELHHLKEELELYKKVHFLYEFGQQSKPNMLSDQMIAELYRISDILLFPSKREGFGIPLLEAGLARIPVFASNLPPILESTGGYANYFDLRTEEPGHVAKRILNYIESNLEYKLRKRILNEFTWDAIVKNQILPLLK